MLEADIEVFSRMLDQTCAILSKGNHKPDGQVSAMWFRVLSAYDIDTVRTAFDAHVRDPDRGRFVPVPADIIAKIHANDGRPSSDEAWAIAVKAANEANTVTWTDEIAEAWGIAKPVWDVGDEIGARMAFRFSYDRLTGEAKQGGKPAKWWPTLGDDMEGRAVEMKRAATAGLLEHSAALMLQAPDNNTLQRLAQEAPPHVREALMALRDKLISEQPSDDYVPSQDALDKRRTRELQQAAQDQTDAYQRETS